MAHDQAVPPCFALTQETVSCGTPVVALDRSADDRRRPVGSLRLIAAAACWLTAITYSSFVFAPWARSRLPVARSYVSELEAAGQPARGFFRLSDVLSGLALVLVAILATRLLPRTRTCAMGCGLLAVAGVASLFDAANSMSCAPSIDAACRARQDTTSGLIQQVTQAHTTSSLVGFLATGIALLLVGVAVSATDAVFARVSIGLAVLTGLLGIGDLVLILAHSLVGVTERARITVFSLWLCALSVRLLRPPAPRPDGVASDGMSVPRPSRRSRVR